jgi:hypothetical protein
VEEITSYQRLELILIPTIFVCSQIFIFFIGLTVIGEETLELMIYPTFLGLIMSIFVIYILDHKYSIKKFKQLEFCFRFLVIIGVGALIPILFLQVASVLTVDTVFLILSLIFSILGGSMIILCFLLLWRSKASQAPLE